MSRFFRFSVVVPVFLGLVLVGIFVKLFFFHERGDDRSAERTAIHAARIGVQAALQSRGATGATGATATGAQASAAVEGSSAHAFQHLTGSERAFAKAGISNGEVAVMKQAWPDWETRFANASDDMVKAHAARVRDLVPTVIPDEVSRVASIDVSRVTASASDDLAYAAPVSAADDVARIAPASAMDDLARAGRGVGGVADDIARGSASMLDDILRALGIGAAGAAAAGGAALSSRKKN